MNNMVDSESSSDDTAEDNTVAEEATAATPPPTTNVKCPDCDLCDGSGRYEYCKEIQLVMDWGRKMYMPVCTYIYIFIYCLFDYLFSWVLIVFVENVYVHLLELW
jgi:hypothetical protein